MTDQRQRRDWIGAWFDLMESISGEFTGMRFGRGTSGSSMPSWTFLPHARFDGIGGMSHLLRTEKPGIEIAQPHMKEAVAPTRMGLIVALLRVLGRVPRRAAAWLAADRNWRAPAGGCGPGAAVATARLSARDTHELGVAARAQGVSINSLLLAAIARAAEPNLATGPNVWLVPVNMRGAVGIGDDTANHSSYLQLELPRGVDPAQAHAGIKRALANREHWGAWLFLNAGGAIGTTALGLLYRAQLAAYGGQPFVGAFSNLGAWDGVGEWYACPPVAKACPVGAAAICCDGRLCLTLEAHRSIALDKAFADALMARWTSELGVSAESEPQPSPGALVSI